jgi:hypothetical protein
VPREMLVEMSIVDQLEDLSDEAIAHEIDRLTRSASPLLASLRTGQQTEH